MVVRGVMYLTSANDVFALDAALDEPSGTTLVPSVPDCSTMQPLTKAAAWRSGITSCIRKQMMLTCSASTHAQEICCGTCNTPTKSSSTEARARLWLSKMKSLSGRQEAIRVCAVLLRPSMRKRERLDGSYGRYLARENLVRPVGPEICIYMAAPQHGCLALTIRNLIRSTGPPVMLPQILMEVRGPATICIRHVC